MSDLPVLEFSRALYSETPLNLIPSIVKSHPYEIPSIQKSHLHQNPICTKFPSVPKTYMYQNPIHAEIPYILNIGLI